MRKKKKLTEEEVRRSEKRTDDMIHLLFELTPKEEHPALREKLGKKFTALVNRVQFKVVPGGRQDPKTGGSHE
jgi:hypothetical protein